MSYTILKHLHMTTAYLTITLFALRLLLDAVGRPGWRQTPLRFIPHINDTILLVAAISLLFVAGYASAMPGWLIAKIVLQFVFANDRLHGAGNEVFQIQAATDGSLGGLTL